MELAIFAAALLILAGTVYLYARTESGSPRTAGPVELSILANAQGDYVYNRTFVPVSAGAVVQFSITNFDPGNHSVPGIYYNVMGTQGGMMQWTRGAMSGSGGMGPTGMRSLAPGEVSHTFTIWMSGYELNVPIPPARGPGSPSVVVFTVQLYGANDLTWQCDAEDMGPSTGPDGGMTGLLAVG